MFGPRFVRDRRALANVGVKENLGMGFSNGGIPGGHVGDRPRVRILSFIFDSTGVRIVLGIGLHWVGVIVCRLVGILCYGVCKFLSLRE